MIIFRKKLLVIETTFLPINETLAQEATPYIKSLALKMWELIYFRILWPTK